MPFAALRLPDGSRLIEAMSIRMVPSLDRSQSPEKGVAGALVSSGGAVHALSLPPLPGAAAEVSAVSTLLKARPMSIRGAQTSASFLDALRTAEVVHFAGHAIVNEHYPLLSRLVLAGSTDDEWVTADQVTSNGPIGARLVFLSACSTQAGRQFGAEGPASLAKAFVVAGAQEVVASLWPVADDRTPHMVAAFYRHWLQNGDAAAALRLASIESIRERKSTPEQWAAWIVVGRSHGGTSAHSNVNTTTGD
jgi:CHAT domain-containing protein